MKPDAGRRATQRSRPGGGSGQVGGAGAPRSTRNCRRGARRRGPAVHRRPVAPRRPAPRNASGSWRRHSSRPTCSVAGVYVRPPVTWIAVAGARSASASSRLQGARTAGTRPASRTRAGRSSRSPTAEPSRGAGATRPSILSTQAKPSRAVGRVKAMPSSVLQPGRPRLRSRPSEGRHHGRHPQLQERRHDRLRRAGGPGWAGPVLPGPAPVLINSDAGSPDGTQRVVVETEPPDYIEQILLVRPKNRLARVSLTYPRSTASAARARLAQPSSRSPRRSRWRRSSSSTVTCARSCRSGSSGLAGPIFQLKGGYDFMAPLYARTNPRHPITNTVTYPLTRALYGHRIRQPIGGRSSRGVGGPHPRHYLGPDDWTPDISKFGIDIWMTTQLWPRVAVCQAGSGRRSTIRRTRRRPRADVSGGRWSGTILRTGSDSTPRTWLPIHGSHDVPAYGFERILEPPPSRWTRSRPYRDGSHTLDATWAEMFSPASLAAIRILAHQAGTVRAARARLADGHDGGVREARPPAALTTLEAAESLAAFHFPDERAEAHLSHRRRPEPGRRHQQVRRGARPDLLRARGQPHHREWTGPPTKPRSRSRPQDFELLKPYLVDRWNATG